MNFTIHFHRSVIDVDPLKTAYFEKEMEAQSLKDLIQSLALRGGVQVTPTLFVPIANFSHIITPPREGQPKRMDYMDAVPGKKFWELFNK